jgi:carbonic anhydrase
MSVLDHVLSVNAEFVQTYDSQRATVPVVRKLAIVACMDYRIPLGQALGLNPGDAYVIRNAGGIVTEDVIRSLLVAYYRLGIEEVLIINHTECGMLTFSDEELRTDIRRRRGTDTIAPEQFHSFRNLEDNVRQQIERVKSHPWIPSRLLVNGCIYDVHTGKLTLVLPDNATTRPLPTLPPLAPL